MRKVIILFLLFFCFDILNAESGRDIVTSTGIKGGLIVHLGCGDGTLTAQLRVNNSYIVQGLDTHKDNIEKARKNIMAKGLYGPVSVNSFNGSTLPYADNMVNLLIADSKVRVSKSEIMRVLVPNGVALIDGKKSIKPIPPEMDEWTHSLHGPDGNAVARDRIVGPPRHLQWIAKPYWARLHDAPSSTSSLVSSGGRVFYIGDEGPAGMYEGLEDKWFLSARDAFNGALLWKKPMPDWGWKTWTTKWHARNNQPFQLIKRMVAIKDTVYVTLGYSSPVTALDAATGKVLKTYKGTELTDEILYYNGLLILSINKKPHEPSSDTQGPIKKRIAVVDAVTGRMLWSTGDYIGLQAKTDSIEPNGRLEMAVGKEGIFFSDRDNIAGLDLKTGKEMWKAKRRFGPKLPANFNTRMYELSVLVYNEGVVLFAQPEGTTSFHSVPGTLYAYDAKKGTILWKHRYGGWVHNTQPNVFVIDRTVWIHEHQEGEKISGKRAVFPKELHEKADYAVLGLDLKTGKIKHRLPVKDILDVGHHHRCYRNKATEKYLLMSRRGVEFIDIKSGENDLNHWTRGDCHLGVMPCNGLLYTTPHPCGCYINAKLNGYFAMAPTSKIVQSGKESPNFEKGPAYGKIKVNVKQTSNDKDWPTFRGDSMRRGSSKASVSKKLQQDWKATFSCRPGPISFSDGKVFVPVIDKHQIVALDALSGKVLWNYTVGSRIDTPPTIHNNMALFGSADGWVYCVRVSDGELIWKRRAAPRERWVGALDQLESAWPVHGSILVKDGVAYLSAGRSSYLDGGIYIYALKPETGDIIEQRVIYHADPETGKMKGDPSYSHTMPGMLNDIPVSDGLSVWIRQEQVFGDAKSKNGPVYATGGFRDDEWFNRTTWAVGPAKHAQLLVCDEKNIYAIESFSSASRAKAFTAGDKGYRLFAKSFDAKKVAQETETRGKNKKKKGKKKKGKKGTPDIWSIDIPVRGTAMALASDVLFVMGSPDVIDPDDPLSSFDGRKGSVLYTLNTANGEKFFELKFDVLPVWDGMAVANNRMYISMKDGSVRCFKSK